MADDYQVLLKELLRIWMVEGSGGTTGPEDVERFVKDVLDGRELLSDSSPQEVKDALRRLQAVRTIEGPFEIRAGLYVDIRARSFWPPKTGDRLLYVTFSALESQMDQFLGGEQDFVRAVADIAFRDFQIWREAGCQEQEGSNEN